MIEPHTTRTYDEAFARARAERAAAFRTLFGLGEVKRERRGFDFFGLLGRYA